MTPGPWVDTEPSRIPPGSHAPAPQPELENGKDAASDSIDATVAASTKTEIVALPQRVFWKLRPRENNLRMCLLMCRNWYGSTHQGAAKALTGKGNKNKSSSGGAGKSPSSASKGSRGTVGAATSTGRTELTSQFGTVRPKAASTNAADGTSALSTDELQQQDEEQNEKELEALAAEQSAVATAATVGGSNVSDVLYATEVEFVMPMVVVVGTLELTATHLTFYGQQFGGPGTGVGMSKQEIDWVPDADRSECALCRKAFTGLFKSGKHHCRACGDIFCATCSDYKRPLPHLGLTEPVRVCATCFKDEAFHLHRGKPRAGKDIGGRGADDAGGGSASSSSDDEDELEVLANGLLQQEERVIVQSQLEAPAKLKTRKWAIAEILHIYMRRYLLRHTALEFFLSNGKSFFLNFFNAGENASFLKRVVRVMDQLPHSKAQNTRLFGLNPRQLVRNSNWTRRWVNREISNFEYLMHLNTAAGRTYNDMTQYPVFPWVIADYESHVLDLRNPKSFRDLSKPVGALNPKRLEKLKERSALFDDPVIPKFLYGTHYSTVGAVLYYLIRMEPFTTYALALQNGNFDHSSRLFQSVAETWQNCLTNPSDLKELIPEWFYSSSFLYNDNSLPLGKSNDGKTNVDDAVLPPWAMSAEHFVRTQREALESEYVSQNLHHWIDLIFGFKQRGEEAVKADNVFYYLTYEDEADTSSIGDDHARQAMEAQISNFGQTPSQLFPKPHPQRAPRRSLAGETPDRSPPVCFQVLQPSSSGSGIGASDASTSSRSNGLDSSSPSSTAINALIVPRSGSEVIVFAQGHIASISFNTSGARMNDRARPVAALAGCSPTETNAETIATLGYSGDAHSLVVTSHWTGQGVIVARADTSRRLQYVPQIEAAALSCVAASETSDHFVVGDVNGRVMVWRCSQYAKQAPAALNFSRTAPPVLPTPAYDAGGGASSGADVAQPLLAEQDVVAQTEAMTDTALGGSPRRAVAAGSSKVPDGGTISYSASGVPLGADGQPLDNWVGHSAPMWPESVLWGHNSPVTCLVVSAALDVVLSGSHRNTLLMHSLTEGGGGKLLREFSLAAPPRMEPLKKNRSTNASAGGASEREGSSGGVSSAPQSHSIGRSGTGTTEGEIESEYLLSCAVRKLALASDGTVIAYCVSAEDGSGLLQALTLTNRSIAERMVDHARDPVVSMALSPDDRYLLVASSSRVQLLHTHTLTTYEVLYEAPASAVVHCATLWFPPNARQAEKVPPYALVGLGDGSVLAFRVTVETPP